MPTSDSLAVTPKLSVLLGIFSGYAIVNFVIFSLLNNGGR